MSCAAFSFALVACTSAQHPYSTVIDDASLARTLGGGASPVVDVLPAFQDAPEEAPAEEVPAEETPAGEEALPEVEEAEPVEAEEPVETEKPAEIPMVEAELTAPPVSETPSNGSSADDGGIPTLEVGEKPQDIPVIEVEGPGPEKEPVKPPPSDPGGDLLEILKKESQLPSGATTFYETEDAVSDAAEWVGRRYSKILEAINPGH